MKIYYSGVSGRGVGKIMKMSKANVYNWIKKLNELWISNATNNEIYEIDELHWYVGRKANSETRENTYVIAMVSREPRQIIGFAFSCKKGYEQIQAVVDSAPDAKHYHTDGYWGYVDVAYPGKHVRNIRNKNDTFTVEGVNADLRHYLAVLARRSRCFCRRLDTLEAVLSVYIDAYNRFGEVKIKYRVPTNHKSQNTKKLHKYRDFPFSLLDFL
jgi:IS1 family transposase